MRIGVVSCVDTGPKPYAAAQMVLAMRGRRPMVVSELLSFKQTTVMSTRDGLIASTSLTPAQEMC